MVTIGYSILAYGFGIFTMMVWIEWQNIKKNRREAKDCEALHRMKLKRDIHKEIKKANAVTKAFIERF